MLACAKCIFICYILLDLCLSVRFLVSLPSQHRGGVARRGLRHDLESRVPIDGFIFSARAVHPALHSDGKQQKKITLSPLAKPRDVRCPCGLLAVLSWDSAHLWVVSKFSSTSTRRRCAGFKVQIWQLVIFAAPQPRSSTSNQKSTTTLPIALGSIFPTPVVRRESIHKYLSSTHKCKKRPSAASNHDYQVRLTGVHGVKVQRPYVL